MEKTGFFEESPGNKSSSRLNSTIIIWSALLMSFVVVITTMVENPDNIVSAAISAGALFITTAGSAMVFQFKQKQTEKLSTDI